MTIHQFDLSPLFRTTVGFDRLSRLLEASARADEGYPPYNIEKVDEDSYRVTLAVAGFGEGELEIVTQNNVLLVRGQTQKDADAGRKYLYRGIAGRAFERRFQLADHIQVTGATLANGLLHIELRRFVPEELKPRRIAIQQGVATQAPTIEQRQAA